MTIIQAYRRDKPYTHSFPDVTLKFKPNAVGHVVCDVQSQSAVERLLQIPTGFRVYESQESEIEKDILGQAPIAIVPTSNTGEPIMADRAKYVLVNGDTTFDLNPLDDAQLREFAAANGIKVHHAAKGDTIRDRIVEALKASESDDKPTAPAVESTGDAGEPANQAGTGQ